jgi:hypothetical protein
VLRLLLPGALLLCCCARVPEQSLRDEQARTRRYRDAYESEHDELVALRSRVAALEKAACRQVPSADPAAPAHTDH